MISVEQIKAARAWLNWSQDELAQETGLSLATIHNLEKGHISYRSLGEIRKTFENKGFEFSGKNGLSRRLDEHRSYFGADGTNEFYDDMLTVAKETNGEIVAIFPTQEMLARSLGVTRDGSLERLEQLSKFATIKCLLSNAHNTTLFIPSIQCRAIPKHPFAPFSSFVYGNKTALVATNGIDLTYFVMTSVSIAQDAFKTFAADWNTAAPIISPARA
ncbi:MAG: helix-turn-helix transcriptional regulator [Alphaproteobacteria bacterium]